MIAFSLLLFGGLYFFFCVWLSGKLTAKVPDTKRALIRAAAFVALLIAPVIDGLVGNVVTTQMCRSYTRTEVLGQTAVPATIIRAGLTKTTYPSVDWRALAPFVSYAGKEQRIGWWPRVRLVTYSVTARDGKELARSSALHYAGGWLPTSSSGVGIGALSCFSEPSLESLLPQLLVATSGP
jgi:hypothetical protein